MPQLLRNKLAEHPGANCAVFIEPSDKTQYLQYSFISRPYKEARVAKIIKRTAIINWLRLMPRIHRPTPSIDSIIKTKEKQY